MVVGWHKLTDFVSLCHGDAMKSLELLDELAAEGLSTFSARDVRERLGLSSASTANLLARLQARGLVDRVARGRYAMRQIGLLGTSAASEDMTLAVGALFGERPHRIAYRSALDLLGLLTHPSRTIQVASLDRVRIKTLSGRPFQNVIERENTVGIGAKREGTAWVSDLERALLDAASRPSLAGGVSALAESMAGGGADAERIMEYAKRLGAGAAIRRLGSVADALEVRELAGRLRPLTTPQSDLDLEPGAVRDEDAWRDRVWHVRWPVSQREVLEVVRR